MRAAPGFSRHQIERVEGLAALAGERYEEAYGRLIGIFSPGHPAFHRLTQLAVVTELAEAAAACGRLSSAAEAVASVRAALGPDPSALQSATLAVAEAMLASDDEAERRYEEALQPGVAAWPFVQARGLLAQGSWLRRHRRIAASRTSLRQALQVFDRLGAGPWSERARRELRAAGEVVDVGPPRGVQTLTAQELQVATLAAQGLTNRQIGERLFLSHRTVATYLYQAYPKLGVTTRGQLAAVLV